MLEMVESSFAARLSDDGRPAPTGVPMRNASAQYVFSIQAGRYYRTLRYYWTICAAQNLDRIVSWGHAASHELAETAAQIEIRDLSSGLTQGTRGGDSRATLHRF